MVAPLFQENETGRAVYLPPGDWIDFQSGKNYSGGWHKIEAGKIPAVILVRDGAAIPEIQLAQSTSQMDWSKLDLVVFAKNSQSAKGLVCLPSDNVLREISLNKNNGAFELMSDPLDGKVTWKISAASSAE